jgi:hypothetical protein
MRAALRLAVAKGDDLEALALLDQISQNAVSLAAPASLQTLRDKVESLQFDEILRVLDKDADATQTPLSSVE